MTFPEAVAAIIAGSKVTRLEWNDKTSYGLLQGGILTICMKGVCHRWIVSDGDLLNNDWVIVEETKVN